MGENTDLMRATRRGPRNPDLRDQNVRPPLWLEIWHFNTPTLIL